VLLHSQSEGRSRIYDLQLVAKEPAVEVDGPVQLHPSLPATAICRQDSGHSQPLPYSPSWVVFRPNVLVDARTGHMWRLMLRLEAAQGDPLTTARLLLNREAGKTPLLRLLRSWLPSTLTLSTLAQILDHVIAALGNHLTQSKPAPPVVIDQPDLFTHLFQGQEDVGVDRLQAVLLELLLCLNRHQVAPRQFLHELLINLSVKSGKFYQLHQILQYGVKSEQEGARESQREPERARVSMPQHCFVAKQLNTTLFCRKTLKYGTFCRKTLKYGTFCREMLKYAL